MTTTIADGKYRLGRELGSGSFGTIYLGTDTTTDQKVAVKVEQRGCDTPQLEFEAKLYALLRGGYAIPKTHYYGVEPLGRVLAMDLLGPSLEDMFKQCNRKFSLKTTLQLADQMLSRIEHMHLKNYIHRDIKPENFLLGNEKYYYSTVYLIDYGLAKRFKNPITKVHIPARDDKSLTGTARYASINSHLGHELSRKDDLEALAYVLIYFLKGSLPWQGIKAASNYEKYELIRQKKQSISIEELCEGLPPEFAEFLTYSRNKLRFHDKPDYKYIHKLFRRVFTRENFKYDFEYDWPERLPPEPPKKPDPPKPPEMKGPSKKTLKRRRQRQRRRQRERLEEEKKKRGEERKEKLREEIAPYTKDRPAMAAAAPAAAPANG